MEPKVAGSTEPKSAVAQQYEPPAVRKMYTPLPKVQHLDLRREDVSSHILIIGDVHGCATEFRRLINQAEESLLQKPTVISVGDLVNKGPLSKDTIVYARENNILTCRGNHDDDLLEAYYQVGKFKDGLGNYHHSTVHEVTPEDIHWLENCPFSISMPWMNLIICHAGIVPGIPIKEQKGEDMLWMRDVFRDPETGKYKTLEVSTEESLPWAQEWKGPELIVFGHDAKRGMQEYPFAIGLDTGCCYGKELTGIIFNADDVSDRQFIRVAAEEMYTDPTPPPPAEPMEAEETKELDDCEAKLASPEPMDTETDPGAESASSSLSTNK